MEEFVTLIMELKRMENTYRDFQHAGKVAASLEALDGENTRLTEQHRALEVACTALQAAHDQKQAVLEKEYAAVQEARTAHAAAHAAAHGKKMAALDEAFLAAQEARTAQAAAHEAALRAALLPWQERAERAREHATTVETHLANTRQAHEQAMRGMRQEMETLQAELATLAKQLADKKEEVQKRFQHLRSLVNRELA